MKSFGMTSPARDIHLLPISNKPDPNLSSGNDVLISTSTKLSDALPPRMSMSAPTSSTRFKGNSNLLPPQSFDLDGLQIKKLERIMNHSHELHLKKTSTLENLLKNVYKVKELEALKQKELIIRRQKEHSQTESPVNRLASIGEESNLRELLRSGECSVTAKDPATGRTILIAAVVAEQSHIVRILIKEFNAGVNDVSLLGQSSPLHFAVLGGYRNIALFLLSAGAIINSQNRQGHTPLHLVNTLGVAKLLLKSGADPLIRCKKV